MLISIAVPSVSSFALIESIPFVGLVDFDDNLINDPVDKSVPSLLISIAVPSVSPFASIDINLPFVASLDSIRNIPFVGLVDFDVNLINDPFDKALLFTWIPVPFTKLFADISINVPPVWYSALIFNTLPPKRDIWQLSALLKLNGVFVALKISLPTEYVVVSTYDNSINPCVSYSQYVSLLFAQSSPTT